MKNNMGTWESPDKFRLYNTATISTGHLRPEELKAIDDLFETEESVHSGYKSNQDIKHNGLVIHPKDHGFYVVIRLDQDDDYKAELLDKQTAEMRKILEIALRDRVRLIDFDTDENPVSFLETFEY